MINTKNDNIVIIGAGATGLTSAFAFSDKYKNIYILERSTKAIYQRQLQARDKHAHVCVGGALAEYEKLIPGFVANLKKNGVTVGDPGLNIKWSTSTNLLPKISSGIEFAYGSYNAFMETLLKLVGAKTNINILFGVNDIVVDKEKNQMTYYANQITTNLSYNMLIVCNGSPGRDNQFLNDNKINYQTRILSGPCSYHSFEVELKSALVNENCFISETFPAIKDLGMLYVPRTPTSGILTLGKFGNDLKIANKEDLLCALRPWEKFIPADFLLKINSISKSTEFRTQEIWWHKLASNYNNSIFLIGDSLLRVPPYTGLGFAVSIQSILSVIESIKYTSEGNGLSFNSIFEHRCKDIFIRLYRYQKHWGLGPKKSKNIWNQLSPFKIFSKFITEFIFKEAQVNHSKAATIYLVRRFHLVQDGNLTDLLVAIFRILAEKITFKMSKYNEKLSESH